MGIVLQDGFPGIGAVTNLGGVDADQHLGVCRRAPAFRTLGAYSVVATTGNIIGSLAAASNLIVFQLSPPNAGDRAVVYPFPLLAIVQSVKASAYVTGTITTAVPFDLALFIMRNGSQFDLTGGGTSATPPNAAPVQAMRTNMSAWRAAPLYGGTGGLVGSISAIDTNPIGRIQGNSGTAVGTQFFAGRNPQPLYVRDNQDHHPIVLQSTNSSGTSADSLTIRNPLIGPATGTFVVEVQISWLEVIAF